MFSKELIYRVSIKGTDEFNFCKFIDMMDTNIGPFLKLSMLTSLGEGEPLIPMGRTEFHYLKDINIYLLDEDNAES